MAIEPAFLSQAQSVRRLSRREPSPRRGRRSRHSRRQPDKFLSRIDLHPPKASRGVSVRPARLTLSALAMDKKRAIAAPGALAEVSRVDLFRLLLACDPRGCPPA